MYKRTMSGHFQPKIQNDASVGGLSGHYLTHFLSALPENIRESVQAVGPRLEDLSGDHLVPLTAVIRLLEAVNERAAPGWHIQPALDLEAAYHGPLGIAVVSAPTVGQGLATLLRFHAVRAPFFNLQSASTDSAWRAKLEGFQALEGAWLTLMEIHVLALAGLIRRMLGPQARKLSVGLPPGAAGAPQTLQIPVCEIIVSRCKDYLLTLPTDALALSCALADRRMHEDAMATLRTLDSRDHHGGALEREIRQKMVRRLSDPPSQVAMARALGMSGRSLHRKLVASGVSYRQILSDVRASVAFHRLRHTSEPISRVASDLGYQDAANFGRACRRWFGCAPGDVRNGAQTCMPSSRIRQWLESDTF